MSGALDCQHVATVTACIDSHYITTVIDCVCVCVCVCVYVCACVCCYYHNMYRLSLHDYTYRLSLLTTRWRRCIECLKLQVIFRKRAAKNRALLRKMTCKDKASYGSSPPCTCSDSHYITCINLNYSLHYMYRLSLLTTSSDSHCIYMYPLSPPTTFYMKRLSL